MGSMKSSMADLKCEYSEVSDSTLNPDAVNNTSYYCLDFSGTPVSDLRNITYDFTTSNTSGSHGNRGRLCVNTDHQHTLPFTNRVAFCDDQTKFVALKCDAHNQDNVSILTSDKILVAFSNSFSKNNNKYWLQNNSVLLIANDYRVPVDNKIFNDNKHVVAITSCNFTNNTSHGHGGAVYIHSDSQESINGNVLITSCSFTNNTSQYKGGAIYIFSYSQKQSINGNVLITSSFFTNNTSQRGEGAISIFSSGYTNVSRSVLIASSSFTNNTSQYNGGAIGISSDSQESNNGNVLITSSSFTNNTSQYGGVLYLDGGYTTVEQSTFTHNEGSVFYLKELTVTFLSGNHFSNNKGSVHAFNSKVEFKGHTIFSDNYHSAVIYAVQSQIYFNSPEGIEITNNTSSLGGGIFLSESTMIVQRPIEISQNTAYYGGGIYAYLSSIEFTSEKLVNRQIMISNNNARQNGGGICAIASTIKISRSFVNIDSNTALVKGGGMYLEAKL